MKRIVIATGIFPPDIGGPASYGKVLAEKLSKEFNVVLVTYSSAFQDSTDKELPFRVIRIWKKHFRFFRHFLYFVRVYQASRDADVVYALNAISAGFPAFIAARMNKKKFFIKIVGDYAWEIAINKNKTFLLLDDFQKAPKHGWIKFLNNIQTKVSMRADGVIVPSKYLAKVVQGWGVAQQKIHVIHNGVNISAVNLSKEEARKELSIPGTMILSIGRLVPWKGFRMLIKLMPKLLTITQIFRLVIVGSGPDYDRLQTMIKNLRLERKVFLVGKKSPKELAVYLAAAEMFVLNTGYEGFSHQILEAMSAGVPVVTTNVGGNREVIVQGENGFMLKYNDEFNLVEAIKTLWQDNELRQKLIAEGRKTAGYFNVETMYQETIKILQSN